MCQDIRSRSGLTLIELVVVLSILAAVSSILIPVFSGTIQNANQVATTCSLNQIGDAIGDYWRDTKHIPLDGIGSVATETNRFDIDWLFANPVTGDGTFDFSFDTRIGWRGPYLWTSTGDQVAAGSPFMIDAWNRSFSIQDVAPSTQPRDLRIVSAGPDGVVSIPPSTATSALTSTDVGDDLYVALTLR
ncbi:type II secretion system protein [Rhodopirellula bahusiensis]